MVTIITEYKGDLHCEATHKQSGTAFTTDAPKDNHGRGGSFSPTDLVAAALGSCILTVMGIMARRLDVNISGATATVEKVMESTPVRRIGELIVDINVPHDVSAKHKSMLERAAFTCPVHKSMHPDVKMPIKFTWN